MIRTTMIFSDWYESEGWSETYYFSGFSSLAAFTQPVGVGLPSPASNLTNARQQLLAPGSDALGVKGAYVRKLRVSLLGTNFRTSSVVLVPSDLARGAYISVPGADPVAFWTRLLVDLPCGDGPHGRLYLGGCAESIVKPPNFFTGATSFTGRLATFRDFLKTLGWNIRRRSQQSPTSSPIVSIAGLTVGPDNRTAFLTPTTILAGGGVAPARGAVIIRGRTPSEWNGVHKYTLDTVGNRLVLGPARQNLADWAAAGAQGTVQLNVPDMEVVTDAIALRFVEHRIGDPFVVYRGRRRRSQG